MSAKRRKYTTPVRMVTFFADLAHAQEKVKIYPDSPTIVYAFEFLQEPCPHCHAGAVHIGLPWIQPLVGECLACHRSVWYRCYILKEQPNYRESERVN